MNAKTKRVAWVLFVSLFTLYLVPLGVLLYPAIRDRMVLDMSETNAMILSGVSVFAIWAVAMLVLLLFARFLFGVMGTHYLHRIVAVGLLLISANVVAANFNDRIDLTSERIYSLSPVTTKILKEIKPERPVRVTAYVSPEVPREYSGVRSTLIGMLRQFQQVGGRNIILRIVDTDRFTDAETEALRYKIEPQEVVSERGGRVTRDEIFLGAVVTAGTDDEVVIPFIDVGTPVEYELTTAIRTLVNAKRKKVGVLRTDAAVMGSSPFPGARRSREWRIVTDLKRQYDVIDVAPLSLKDVSGIKPEQREFDVLLAVMPSSLTDPEMEKLVTYVKSGGPAMLIDDPLPFFHTQLLPRNPMKPQKNNPQMQMMGMQHPMPEFKSDEGKATKLMNALGIVWDNEAVVWDAYDPHPDLSEILLANRIFSTVYIGPKSGGSAPFNSTNNITSGLQEVMTFYPGEIRIPDTGKPATETPAGFTPLLRTSAKSAVLKWDKYTRTSLGSGELELVPPADLDLEYRPAERVIAARITGKPAGAPPAETSKDGKPAAETPSLNVVFLSDLDMISDPFFQIRDKEWHNLKLDNITFVMNALDELAGDDEFVTLRKRRAKHRTLSVIERQTERFKHEQADEDRRADKEAREELDTRKASLGDEVKKIQNDKSLDSRTRMIQLLIAQAKQQQLMNQAEKEISDRKSRRKRESRMEFEKRVRRIENNVRTLALILLPLPVLLVGSFVFITRMSEERQGANPNRIRARS